MLQLTLGIEDCRIEFQEKLAVTEAEFLSMPFDSNGRIPSTQWPLEKSIGYEAFAKKMAKLYTQSQRNWWNHYNNRGPRSTASTAQSRITNFQFPVDLSLLASMPERQEYLPMVVLTLPGCGYRKQSDQFLVYSPSFTVFLLCYVVSTPAPVYSLICSSLFQTVYQDCVSNTIPDFQLGPLLDFWCPHLFSLFLCH
jgi:hypothetical protein